MLVSIVKDILQERGFKYACWWGDKKFKKHDYFCISYEKAGLKATIRIYKSKETCVILEKRSGLIGIASTLHGLRNMLGRYCKE